MYIQLLLICTLFIPLSACAADQEASTTPSGPRNLGNVLCLGDSITECQQESGTWRYGLWKDFVDGGYTFDFIGTQGRNNCGRDLTPEYQGRKFDTDNEGHGGWTSQDLLTGRGDDTENTLPNWLKDYTPDTVLLHIGGNDLHEAEKKPWAVLGIVQKMQANVGKIIRVLQADNPEVTIYLALHVKVNGDKIPFGNGAIALYNAGLPAVARETSTETSKVILVDQNSGWSNALILEDGMHPNVEGQARMAERWFEAIDKGPREITVAPPL